MWNRRHICLPEYSLARVITSNTSEKSFSKSKKKTILNGIRKKNLIKILKASLEAKEDSEFDSYASSKNVVVEAPIADNDPYNNFFGHYFEGKPKFSDDLSTNANCQIFHKVPQDC